MIKIIITFLFYIFILFNSNLIADENDNKLKIGLLAPFSGEYKNLGESFLLSTQLALNEIGDKNTIFISLSNKEPKISNNVINIGISLESQLKAIEQFLKKQKKNNTLILYPKNEYEKFIDKKIKLLRLKNVKIFKYNPEPKVLTGELEKLTNYKQRKNKLEKRKKFLKRQNDEKSKIELKILDRLYTLGSVDFDSVIIIDFGNSLKSVLASLIFVDVDDKLVTFITVNQWFDESLFSANSVKNLFFPSVDMSQFKKYNENYYRTFSMKPDEITILSYDALGLIYYVWEKNSGISTISDFFIKEKIKGKIGTFEFKDNKVSQQLIMYKTGKDKFKEY